MKINIWKNQREIEKTYEVDAYDIMYGTVEDILGILDGIDEKSNNMELLNAVSQNREKLNELLLDVFPEMTPDELKRVKMKELIPLLLELFTFIGKSFQKQKN